MYIYWMLIFLIIMILDKSWESGVQSSAVNVIRVDFYIRLYSQLEVFHCVRNHQITINPMWRMIDLQMLIANKSLGVRRWTQAFWNSLEMYYKIECCLFHLAKKCSWYWGSKSPYLRASPSPLVWARSGTLWMRINSTFLELCISKDPNPISFPKP